MKRSLWVILLSAACGMTGAQAWSDLAELECLLNTTVHDWRFAMGSEDLGAQARDFVDSDWQQVDVGHRWWPNDSTCWFRRCISIPRTLNGVDVTGSQIRLQLGVDNECKAYVNGEFRQQFARDAGDIVLTEKARPGDVVVVALFCINRPGYGSLFKARLVSSATLEMVSAACGVEEHCERVLANSEYFRPHEADYWGRRVDAAMAEIDRQAFFDGNSAKFLASLRTAEQALLADLHTFDETLDALRKNLATLDEAMGKGHAKGLQLAYEGVDLRVVRSFIEYAQEDAQGPVGHQLRAIGTVRYLQWLLADVQDRIENTTHADPGADRRVPRFHTGSVTVSDGAFWQDGRPVLFTGVGHFGQVRQDIPILKDYGLNIVQIEMGPNGALPDAATVDRQAIQRNVVDVLDNAARHDIAVNLLVSPHYFPQWAIDLNPALAECGEGFTKYCVEAPDARAVIEKYLRALMPMIKDHPALHSICLSNEPQYKGYCEHSRAQFHQWLKDRFGNVREVNQIYGADFRSLDDVPMPRDEANYALYFDWCRFNQDRFLEFHAFERSIIHEYDPDLPVHAKVQMYAFEDPGKFAVGLNIEDFNRLGAITGNDALQLFDPNQPGDYAQFWRGLAMNYTFQHSTAPKNPIFNSEDHIIVDGDWRFNPEGHIRTAYWVQALHGQGAATTWVWERSQVGDFAENILTRANCVRALGHINLDMNRLSRELYALQRAEAPLAFFYAYSSLLPSMKYIEEAEAAFEGASFADVTSAYITERQVAGGKLRDYRLVVVPRASHAPDEVVDAFQQYIESGGTVMTVAACFSHDEYGHPRKTGLEQRGKGRLVVYPDPLTPRAYRDIISRLLDDVDANRPVRLTGSHDEAVWGVNLRTARTARGRLVSLVNHGRHAQIIKLHAARPVMKAEELITGERVTFPLAVEPLQPVLLLIEP